MKQSMKVTLLFLSLASAPAWAMDCTRATSALDKRICASRDLKAADDAMSAAYVKLLKDITDPEIHTSLIESQRRWIKVREQQMDDVAKWSDGTPEERAQRHAILLGTTRERTKFLSARIKGEPRFLAIAHKQQSLASAYSGGPYAGYGETRCDFIPDRTDPGVQTYNCFGQRSYQNGNRVCSETNDFASYHIETTRTLAVIEKGQWIPVASFTFPDEKWVRSTEPASALEANPARLPRIDPEAEFDEDDDKGWMRSCLTDASFPFNGK